MISSVVLFYFSPEFLLATASLLLLVFGAFFRSFNFKSASYVSIFILLLTLYFVVVSSGQNIGLFKNTFIINPVISFIKVTILIAVIGNIIILNTSRYNESIHTVDVLILYLLSTAGMLCLTSANSLLTLYLALELMSFPLYILAAADKNSPKSSEAGLKYFILGSLTSGLFLFGASFIYGFSGTVDFDKLHALYTGTTLPIGVLFGVVMVMVAMFFKISAVPFHMWTPDVYEGSHIAVLSFFSVAPKIASLTLFARLILEIFGGDVNHLKQIVIFASAASMLLGSFATLRQYNIKRLLAYSAIANIGFMLIPLTSENIASIEALIIYMIIYLSINLSIFTILVILDKNEEFDFTIDQMKGLHKNHPYLAFALAVGMFSLAGIPPLAGFMAKFYVLMDAVKSKLYFLAIIGVITSVVSAFYYLKIIKIIYFDEPIMKFSSDKIAILPKFTITISTLFNLGFILFTMLVVTIINEMVNLTICLSC